MSLTAGDNVPIYLVLWAQVSYRSAMRYVARPHERLLNPARLPLTQVYDTYKTSAQNIETDE